MDENYRYLRLSTPLFETDNNDSNKIMIVSLDRPQKHNALNARLWKEIGMLFSQIAASPRYSTCRCVLLIGNGPSFCSGIDFRDPTFFPPLVVGGLDSVDKGEMDVARVGLSFDYKLKEMQQAFTSLEDCPVPVVAAVHGNVVGGAIDLIAAAQVRMCTSDSIFSIKEVAVGLAADVGTLQRLPKIVGNQSLVHELCYTGRSFTAETALQLGLVSRVIGGTQEQLCQEALQLCKEIARHSPLAVHGTKRALIYSRDHSVAEGLEQIVAYNRLALQAPDTQTAITAALTREGTPQFSDLAPQSRL